MAVAADQGPPRCYVDVAWWHLDLAVTPLKPSLQATGLLDMQEG